MQLADPAGLRGRFIGLEGIDGAGTTTQLNRLAEWLTAGGFSVLSTFEPSDGPIGRHIRRILRHEEAAPPDAVALLFAADRVDHLAREIQPFLARGGVVVCDRFLGSSFAYQGAFSDPAWVREINRMARHPDLTLLLRLRPEVALARIGVRDGARRELFEQRDALERIAAAYDAIYPGELPAVVIDAEAAPDAVFAACINAVRRLAA